jgi:hypothetical protein
MLIGGAAFAAASVLASLSTSPEMLIVARGLQGIAGAALLPSMMALVFGMFPDPQQRTAALGVMMGTFALGAALGPLLGGGLLELFDWRAVFVPNVPVMAGLIALAALGVEIGPLVAGAGVVGLAVGFGAQTLVKDVISGMFFLFDDAFRIGEYIESGTSIKGTVERITLRTVALRHHNGPLHFVPYGALGTVRNTSRDWVIEKFNLPLPVDADSEKIRKLIKRVGEELMADAEVGHLLLEPLKGKLYRVDPGVKIFRCKFRTAPGNQFDVRAQAYKRIEAALKSIGVGFADGKTVVVTT